MKNTILPIFAAALLVACGGDSHSHADEKANTAETKTTKTVSATYSIDKAQSELLWKGSMLGMYAHEGTIDISSGEFTVADGIVTDASFVVNMKSINPTDDGYDPENGKGPDALIGHLSSDDFFSVEKYPTAMLTIKGGKAMLKVRDKQNVVELDGLELKVDGDKVIASGELDFDRKQFGVAFDHPAKEMVLGDDIELDFTITASKK